MTSIFIRPSRWRRLTVSAPLLMNRGVCKTLSRTLRDLPMLPISRRHNHFVFGVIQSGLTSLIAAAIASYPLYVGRGGAMFLQNWMASWLVSWVLMLPFVLFAAPVIRSLANALTRDDTSPG